MSGTFLTEPCITTSASVSPVSLTASLEALAVLAAVLELERVERHHLGGELGAGLGIEEEVEALACREAIVEAALRADVQVVLEVGEVEHRLARGHLLHRPSGTAFFCAVPRA
jgi:hypothetical protein